MHTKSIVVRIALLFVALTALDVSAAEVKTEQVQTVAAAGVMEKYIRTADNFVILYDASGSMDRPYKDTGLKMIEAAEKALKEKVALMPELGWQAGLYLFTPWEPYYEMQPFDQAKFAAAVDRLPDTTTAGTFKGQPTPLVEGLEKLDPILAKVSGKTVVFIFTDGNYKLPVSKKRPLEVIRDLTAKHDVCFYVISTAGLDRDIQILEQMAAVNMCSRVIPFNWLLGHPHRTTGALYTVKSIPFVVMKTETKVTDVKVHNITFAFDEPNIRPDDHDRLNTLGQVLKENPQADVLLEGFTDSTGPDDYNMHLSRRRAFRVMQYLQDEFQIPRERIIVHWYGKINPIADNATAEGRQQNRRVEVEVVGL
ncbi:MAG: OmpA family protein [Desulfobacterales bacterium]|nr:OmpA family protein [Desulfobacterales bacterium]